MNKPANQKKSYFPWIYIIVILVGVGAFLFVKEQRSKDQAAENSTLVQTPPVQSSTPENTVTDDDTDSDETDHSGEGAPRIPAYHQNLDSVQLAQTMDPKVVAPEAQEGYQIARTKPKLLAQLPCYCYCDRFGHGSLQDCFVTNHAETCDICLKEAIEANQMDQRGMPAPDIREKIVSKYSHESH